MKNTHKHKHCAAVSNVWSDPRTNEMARNLPVCSLQGVKKIYSLFVKLSNFHREDLQLRASGR